MVDSNDLLSKILKMDFFDSLHDTEQSQTQATDIYQKLQAYYQHFFFHFSCITQVSQQIQILMQDFEQENNQFENVASFIKEGTDAQTRDIQKSLTLINDFTEKINGMFNQSKELISLAYNMEKNNTGVHESVNQLVINQTKNDEAINAIYDVIKNLVDRTQKIGEITNLINKISSETNLLGLNAKVEAVHAGAAGRGFSVVASEIQRLSKESQTASINISEMLKGISDKINMLEKVVISSKDTFSAQHKTVTAVNGSVEKNSAFIDTFTSEQKSFNASIEIIKQEADILVNSIKNIFGSVRQITATTNEITSLTYDHNNTIAKLGKLKDDLVGSVDALNEKSKDIHVQAESNVNKKVMMVFDYNCEFFEPTIKEAEKSMDLYGFDVEVYAPNHRGIKGTQEMLGFLKKAENGEYDALIISPHDDISIFEQLKIISQTGTKIVFINSKIEGIDYVSYIQTKGSSAGEIAAQTVIGAMGDNGEVIVNAWSDMHIAAIEERRNGFTQEIKRKSNIKVHEVSVLSQPTSAEAESAIASMLASHPNARFVFMTNVDWGILFAEYVRKHRPNVAVITIDFTKQIQTLMNEKLLDYAIGQRNYSWGTMAFDALYKSFNNLPVRRYIDTGTYEVNQQNIDIYSRMV